MMPKPQKYIEEKYDLRSERVLLSGAQAVVRLLLMQKAIDKAAGINTAGYATGYRGSPLANLEGAFDTAASHVAAQNILFQPAINEDLAATAIWGSQQAELRGDGRFDGVFALWYGKGPGVDRSGDALRHANHAGTSKYGGVLALMGDDHTCESSTSAHQSEFAFIDAMIPIFSPSNVQEIIDFGLIGYALSRYAGVWVGLKCVKDTAESTATVIGGLARYDIKIPSQSQCELPPGGLNIRTKDHPLEKETRLHFYKQNAIHAFQRANNLNKRIWTGGNRPKIGLVTAGKSYADTRQALKILQIDEARAEELDLALLKIAMPWPLEPRGLKKFAQNLEAILVIEEKRAIIEPQLKEILYNEDRRPQIYGKHDEQGQWLLPSTSGLDVLDIADAIARVLKNHASQPDEALNKASAEIRTRRDRRPSQLEPIKREAYFCAGCPHNRSTTIPEGARAYAGIGCHYMVQWMDRDTEGFTQMGAEGANWVGEAPFSNRRHMFQNIGDGTYVHSGSLAIRAAIAAGTNITFKILFNDAVAMTGGQPLEGGKTVLQMASETKAEGAHKVAIVTETPENYRGVSLPEGVRLYHRDKLHQIQKKYSNIPGVTVIIYDQTCAAEKRRRRKHGTLLQPDTRVFINPLVCEGCGDCGQVSNCVAIIPLETEFGRKREIDPSTCNFDLTCLEGNCPSFVTLKGAKVKNTQKKSETVELLQNSTDLPDPSFHPQSSSTSILAAGVGGTGIVTISSILGQAAHHDGKAFGAIDVTGLAQKGGAVICHMRIADHPEQIHAIQVGTEGADLVIGGDLVVTASNKVLDSICPAHTAAIISNHEIQTGEFTRDPDAEIPAAKLTDRILDRLSGAPYHEVDAQTLARSFLGDSIFANMILLGAAYQTGHIPLPRRAIEQAIGNNQASAANNILALRLGRLVICAPDKLQKHCHHDHISSKPQTSSTAKTPTSTAEKIDLRARELTQYQNKRLADRYRARVSDIATAEQRFFGKEGELTQAVAISYFKLLAVKDEYEVARLTTDGRFGAHLEENFADPGYVSFHFSPPGFRTPQGASSRPRKVRLAGFWMKPILRLLASARGLRGSSIDPFGYSNIRRIERELVSEYEKLLEEIVERLTPERLGDAVALARLPQKIRGFGDVKLAAIAEFRQKNTLLLKRFLHQHQVEETTDKGLQQATVR